jgi:multidrug efflux pump
MGIAVIGGLIFSTFLTLVVVPVMYTFISRKTTAVSNVTEQEYLPEQKELVEN